MIQKGSTVKIHYTLTVEGNQIDSSVGKEPLTYSQGSGQIIPGLETQLQGMAVGDKKHIVVPAKEGYGEHNPNALQKVPKEAFPKTQEIKVGDVVRGQRGNETFQATVSAIAENDVTLDFNHPLTGKTLNFDVEIMDAQPPQ